MLTTFKHGQIRYSLVVAPEGRRDRERRLEDIKADPTIMGGKKGQHGKGKPITINTIED
jgi:hypothetical protein